MPNFVAVWRLLRVAEHLLTGAVIALVIAAGQRFGVRWERIPDLVSWWHKRLCRALGMRVQVTGAPAPSALMVANHVSWLDIPVIGAQGRIGFLSKSEVGRWPLIGWMATIAGTLFLTRGAIQAGEVICRIEERLRAGGGLVVFPEGTTTDGTRLQRFHPRLLAAGQRGGVQVQPVALRFGENAAPDRVAPFLGDDALLALRAFKHIAEGTPHARFVLVGDGPERERLRHDHPELILPGVKVGMELAEHYASGDLFLFPSLTETFGNVVLEAMASGLPVIAFDYAAAAACIRNRDNGFRVPMGDADAFVDAAVAAVGDSSRLGFMSEAARTAAESMSWGQVVQDLERRFFDVIRLRRERPNETLAATLE